MPGEYSLQARIAAEHATTSDTDWPRIAQLYAELERLAPSPVVRLNRAVAVAEAGSPEAALQLIDGLDAELPSSHLLPSVRGELLIRLDRPAERGRIFQGRGADCTYGGRTEPPSPTIGTLGLTTTHCQVPVTLRTLKVKNHRPV